jgi:hypothetical protein
MVMFVVSLILPLLMLYNYIFPLNAILANRDYVLQLWDLWLVNESITHLQSPYFTLLQYYPIGASLGRHVLCPGFFPFTFLVQQLSGGDSFYPLYTYRLIIWLSYTLIFYLSYLTLRELGLSQWPAIIPALSYAFGEFYMNNIVRLHIIAGFFIPLIAFFLVRFYRQPCRSTFLVCTVLLALGLYFTELTLFVYISIVFLLIIVVILPAERQKLRRNLAALGLKFVLLGAVIFLLLILPFGYHWFISDVEPPSPGTGYRLTANLAAFFIPRAKATPLYGNLFDALSSKITVGHGEFEQVFIGFPVLLFGAVALIIKGPHKRLVWVFFTLALIFFVFSLGPTLKLFSLDTRLPLPYALFGAVPPFNMGRTPIRFVVLALFFWMLVAGFGLQWFQQALTPKFGRRIPVGGLVLIFLWTVAEVYSPLPPQPPYQVPSQINQLAAGPIIHLPLKYHDGWSLLLQMFHHQPLATGYVSRNSLKQRAHFKTLEVLYAEALKAGSCEKLEALGYRNVIVSTAVPADIVFGLIHSPHCRMTVIDLRE